MSSHQDYYEHEVSFGGEADLLRHYKRCKKNPGHSHFIPVQNFTIEHLPPDYRDNDIFELIKAEADLVCRLRVDHTSPERPKYHPIRKQYFYPFFQVRGGNFMRTGTGNVYSVAKYTEEDNTNCECEECCCPSTHIPHKVWGKVYIYTAMHVLYNDDEVRRATCYFGYDTNTTWLSQCFKLTGLRIDQSNNVQDICKMTYVTHDMEIIEKLYKMDRRRVDLLCKVIKKHMHMKYTGLDGPCPVVIISHPHGHSKQITVGEWTDRQTWGEPFKNTGKGWDSDMILTSYTYNTHTCPGSSGALVYRLPQKGKWWELLNFHYHSEGGEGNTNNNKSVICPEFVSPAVSISEQK